MIDAKSFMEFFEKEYGVKFVDASTGKNALDVLKEERICGKCQYGARADGVTDFVEDIVCVNGDSRHVTDFRMNDDTCELWESEEKEEELHDEH